MSYLSTTENVGFSGIPQNISDASCATQYKMAVEGVSANCSEVNMFINDSSGDEQNYITHLNDNFFHTKFKIDPNELYTFHDSDVIASEITVGHTEDNYVFTDTVDIKSKPLDSPNKEIDLIGSLTNGETKKDVVSNGHYSPISKPDEVYKPFIPKEAKSHAKVSKVNSQSQAKEPSRSNSVPEVRRPSVNSPKAQALNEVTPALAKSSINSVNSSSISSNIKPPQAGLETFLDVFKREQGLFQTPVKTEPAAASPPSKPVVLAAKKTPTASKTPLKPKERRGRGPAMHEALQRIPVTSSRAVPYANNSWHAPGDELFQCMPLENTTTLPFTQVDTSSDDDNMPNFDAGTGPVCVEETAVEYRGARLALRRAALRRHVAQADTALRLAKDFTQYRTLARVIKKQLRGQGPKCRLPTQTVNHLVTLSGLPSVLTSQERRRLRESGWSGGESGRTETHTTVCAEEKCTQPPLPCARYCLPHVTQAPEQRLYAACAAVFAGGARCKQPLLPLQDQTPLCPEHAWKRDNYDKLTRDAKPKKAPPRRAWPPPPRAPRAPRTPRRARRRRRHPPRVDAAQSLSEINVCSNSSAYDSSEDAGLGALSDTEYIAASNNSHELEGQVPPEDILDPAVLSQIPDEAFTEFFNQAEGTAPFAESSELAAALEAVLDERALDSIADCVFTAHPVGKTKVQQTPVSAASSASS